MISIFPNSFAYTWGSISEERSLSYPCDSYMFKPDDILFRAVTVYRKKEDVFKWICQLKVTPYSYDLIDNFGKPSPRKLFPGLDKLEVGESFMKIFKLVDFKPNEYITLVLDHSGAKNIFGEIICCYVVKSISPLKTRLIVKLLVKRTSIRPFAWMGLFLPWGDLIMMRKQLLNLKELCEQQPLENGT